MSIGHLFIFLDTKKDTSHFLLTRQLGMDKIESYLRNFMCQVDGLAKLKFIYSS